MAKPRTIAAVRIVVGGAGWRNYVFVLIDTDDGLTGLGEASLGGQTNAVLGAVKDLEPLLLGADATRIEHLWQQAYRHAFWHGGPVLLSALAGVEVALWDILGKALGVPVYDLLGGRVRDRVRLYANGPRGDTPEAVAESCAALVAAGWRALRLVPFQAVPGVAGQRELNDARRQMELIRDAVGPDVDVLIDCHDRFSPAAAIQMAEALDEFDIFFLEEPVLPEDPRAMAEAAARISIPVATGERLFTKWGFRDVLALGAADVLQPNLAHCGGIWEGRKIAAAAEVSYVGIAPPQPQLLAADDGFAPARLRHPELPDPGVAGRSPAGGGAVVCFAIHPAAWRLGRTAHHTGSRGGARLGRRARPRAASVHPHLPAVALARRRVGRGLVARHHPPATARLRPRRRSSACPPKRRVSMKRCCTARDA